jgi:hypothetical protein
VETFSIIIKANNKGGRKSFIYVGKKTSGLYAFILYSTINIKAPIQQVQCTGARDE